MPVLALRCNNGRRQVLQVEVAAPFWEDCAAGKAANYGPGNTAISNVHTAAHCLREQGIRTRFLLVQINAVTPGCICEQGNRHTKSDAKLRQKITGHEPSTRHKFHVKFMPGDIDGVIENTDHHAEDVREDAAAVVDAAAAEEVDGEEDEGAGPAKDTRLDF